MGNFNYFLYSLYDIMLGVLKIFTIYYKHLLKDWLTLDKIVQQESFCAYTRWFPVTVRVSFMVTIDLYWATMFGFFSRNALTLLYVTIPVDDTVSI